MAGSQETRPAMFDLTGRRAFVSGAAGRLEALEALRGLSECRQAEISDEEVLAFGCVKEVLSSLAQFAKSVEGQITILGPLAA